MVSVKQRIEKHNNNEKKKKLINSFGLFSIFNILFKVFQFSKGFSIYQNFMQKLKSELSEECLVFGTKNIILLSSFFSVIYSANGSLFYSFCSIHANANYNCSLFLSLQFVCFIFHLKL